MGKKRTGYVMACKEYKKLELQEYEIPEIEPGGVLMKGKMANICGSDIHIWRWEHPLKGIVSGHEMMGTVEELGEGVTTDYANQPLKIGDRICPIYWVTCFTCEACKRGNFAACSNSYMYKKQPAGSYPYFIGGHAQYYYIHPNQHFYKIPDEIPDTVAAGLNCGIAQMQYVVEESGVKPNDVVVFQGAGGLGLFGSAVAKESGATVIVVDSVDSRLEMAKRFGADYTINMKEFDTAEKQVAEVKRLTNGYGADIVYEVCGVPKALEAGYRMVRPAGLYCVIGNVGTEEDQVCTLQPGHIVRNAITVKGFLRYQPWYLYKTIQFVAKYIDKYPYAELSDRVFKLSELQEAMELSEKGLVQRASIATDQI